MRIQKPRVDVASSVVRPKWVLAPVTPLASPRRTTDPRTAHRQAPSQEPGVRGDDVTGAHANHVARDQLPSGESLPGRVTQHACADLQFESENGKAEQAARGSPPRDRRAEGDQLKKMVSAPARRRQVVLAKKRGLSLRGAMRAQTKFLRTQRALLSRPPSLLPQLSLRAPRLGPLRRPRAPRSRENPRVLVSAKQVSGSPNVTARRAPFLRFGESLNKEGQRNAVRDDTSTRTGPTRAVLTP